MVQSRRGTEQADIKRYKRNLSQTIRRARKNNNPLRIGKDTKGNAIYIHGKTAQKERIKIARSKAQVKIDQAKGLRLKGEDDYTLDARNLDFSSRREYDQHMHFNNAQAQSRRLNDKANSIRQSFQTKSDGLGISKKVMNDFDEFFGSHNNQELLKTINQNIAARNLTFNEVFGSDQPMTDDQQYQNLINMYQALGLQDKISSLSPDDINSGYVDNSNYTHYDFEQNIRKMNRRAKGLV